MKRSAAIGNLLQAGIFAAAAWWLGQRWAVPFYLAIGCGTLQILAAIAVLMGRTRLARWSAIGSLVIVGIVAGMYIDAALHLQEAYGSDAAKIGRRSIWTAVGALPWFVAFPLWQSLAGGKLRDLLPPITALLLAIAVGGYGTDPVSTWPAQPDQAAAAAAAFSRWTGSDATAAVPSGVGPAAILLTPWIDGKPGKSVRGDGNDLAEAVTGALTQLPPPSPGRTALVLDVARSTWPRHSVVRAAQSGGLSKKGGVSPSTGWHSNKVRGQGVLPLWRLPRPDIGKRLPTTFESTLATAEGTTPLVASWSAPPELTAENVLATALAGGRMLAHHQNAEGKFAYTVLGPSGKVKKKGYNFPRHAGTTWFLARLAVRTGDPEIGAAVDAGLQFMEAHTTYTSAGGAYLHDPRRKDGKTWAGTTALAALAADVRGHPLALPWGRFLASTVDDRGQVRGNVSIQTETADAQPKNPYGQGQVVLALAVLVRSGHEELRPALLRAAAFMDGDYAPGAVGRLLALDEHWTCLAALVAQDALGSPHGMEVCQGYLASEAHQVPEPSQHLRPHAGSAGGLAEAVVAGAVLDPDGPWRAQALAYGRSFLANAYRATDGPFLIRPEALIGGFRDTPSQLHVRMDAVQHVGCALLGIEALLSSAQPGSMP